jgi:glycerol-3-phosphate acyltransferase PlsY
MPVTYVVFIVVAYLLGSVPFAFLIARAHGKDLRTIGSGNIGATNVLRTGNKTVAALTLLLDALKGAVPVLAMSWIYGSEAGILAGLAAFFGHLFPLWLGFKGGKGVATNIGVLFGLFWPLGFLFLAVWLAMAFLFRRSSLAALSASMLTPVWTLLFDHRDLLLPTIVMGAAIWLTHRANIARLLRGEEPKITLKRSP